MPSKRQGCVAVARTATTAVVDTPKQYLMVEDGDTPLEPTTYKRKNNVNPFTVGMKHAGLVKRFSASNAECDARQLGYLLWLFSGDAGYSRGSVEPNTDVHTIVPGTNGEYFTAFKYLAAAFITTDETVQVGGCRMSSLSLQQGSDAYAQVSCEAPGCVLGTMGALTPSLTLTDVLAPLNWHTLRAGGTASGIKLGYNGATQTEDGNITGFKLDLKWESNHGAKRLSTDDPSQILQGGMDVSFEVEREFGDAATAAEYLAWTTGQEIAITLKWLMSTYYVQIEIPHAYVNAPVHGSIGVGADAITARLSCEAFAYGADAVYTVTVKDGQTTDYSAL